MSCTLVTIGICSRTNQNIVEQKITGAIDSVLTQDSARIDRLSLHFGAVDKEEQFFIKSILLNWATEKRRTLVPDSSSVRLTINECKIQVTYSRESFSLFGFDDAMQRLITIHVAGWLDIAGEHTLPVRFAERYQDIIEIDEKGQVELSPYMFVKGTLREHGIVTQYLQPGIVMGAVAAIIYLFFSLRI